MTNTFKLERLDGTPAAPPSFKTTVLVWNPGDTIRSRPAGKAGAPRSSTAGTTFVYPRSELALRHGVGVETETRSPREAQSQLGIPAWRYRRPDDWNALPWA